MSVFIYMCVCVLKEKLFSIEVYMYGFIDEHAAFQGFFCSYSVRFFVAEPTCP